MISCFVKFHLWAILGRSYVAWTGAKWGAGGKAVQPGAAYDDALEVVMPTLPMKATKVPPADISREVYVQASVVERTNQETLQGFVNIRKEDGAKVYHDEHGGYIGLDNHEVVKHSVGEYVKN